MMNERPLSRRGFLAGCAGAGAAIACAPALASEAFAAGGEIGSAARPAWDTIHTICQGCPNACGYTAYTVEGKLGKTIGDAGNPNAAGRLCARGYGYTQAAFSTASVKNPLRRKDNGSFQTISWDDAILEIGNAIHSIVRNSGAEAVSLVYDETLPFARSYSNSLMNGIGGGNCFVDDLTFDTTKAAALIETIGADSYFPDIERAELVMLIDSSMTDIASPDLAASLEAIREAGKRIIAVDPRLGTIGSFATDWYAVNPGTELALLLAVCNHLVSTGRYDKDYVSANVAGFDLWASAISAYTPRWAQDITGIEDFRIEELASLLAACAPHVAIEYGNGSIAGASFANSGNTVRVICLLNALLGAWNQTGGALLPFDYEAALAARGISSPSAADNLLADEMTAVGIAVPESGAGASQMMALEKRNHIKCLICLGADVAYDYSAIKDIDDIIESMDLVVCVTQEMTRTAELADYVLPLSHYLYTSTPPRLEEGTTPTIVQANAVLERSDGDNSLPLDAIVDALATASESTVRPSEAVSAAASEILAAAGLTEGALGQIGSSELTGLGIERITTWRTPTGLIQCASQRLLDAGSDLMPIWQEPASASDVSMVIDDDLDLGQRNDIAVLLNEDAAEPVLHLITGQQTVIGMHGYNTAELMDIAKMYELDRVWINADIADTLGISDGDEVLIHNGECTGIAKAFVTNRIVPSAAYLPLSFGRTAERQRIAKGKGLDVLAFGSGAVSPGYGALCLQEASVTIRAEREGA